MPFDLELDKDILVPGNKIYGPDTCLIVRPSVNCWFRSNGSKNNLPQGVCVNSRTGKPYRAQITPIGGKRTHLGYFDTPEEASKVYQQKWKEQVIVLIEQEENLQIHTFL